jgi:hypothetical protein
MSAAPALALVPRRMSLFELVRDQDNIAELVFALEDADELTPELADELQRLLIDAVAGTRAKVDRCSSVLQRFESAEASALEEAARLAKRAAQFKRNRERLELTILAVLETSKLDKIDGETATLARRRNPAKVIVVDESEIPLDFWRSPPIPPVPADVPDKKLIAAALKSDPASVPGARLETSFRLVRS